jgi:hypothetical protein
MFIIVYERVEKKKQVKTVFRLNKTDLYVYSHF